MWMELQDATTHDFLSLYTTKTKADAASSSLIQHHHHDTRPSSHQGGFMLKTHDFLQPLENKRTAAGAEPPPQSPQRTASAAAAPTTTSPPDINAPPPQPDRAHPITDHVLPGGVGTFTISHVTAPAATRPVVVKPEWPTPISAEVVTVALSTAPPGSVPAVDCRTGPAGWGTLPNGKEIRKPAVPVATAAAAYAAGAFSLWGEGLPAGEKVPPRGGAQPPGPPTYQQHPPQQSHPILHQQRQQHQLWAAPPVYAAARSSNSSFGSLSSTRSQATQDKRRFMDAAASNFSKGFTDDDDDEDVFGRREGTSAKELNVRVDDKTNTVDQKPSTPRSKHSATEQRRRSKINDRFQILRNLIPHTDQKRDKASFLLEVIEYIQFLQEKVQRYENEHPGWNQDDANIPWKVPTEGTSGPSEVPQNGPAPRVYVNSDEAAVIGDPVLTNTQTPLESENVSSGLQNKPSIFVPQQFVSGIGLAQQQQRLNLDPENVAYQSRAESARIGNDVLNQHELTIDDGTISISSVYSQGILNALAHALQNSGVDLSQASVSVQINLGRRAFSRPVSVPNDREGPSCGNQVIGHSRSGSSGEESEKAKKRQKSSKS